MSKKKFTPETILLIPDVHAMPGDKLERFGKLHNYLAANYDVDRIVMIGDVWDFGSLCLHDKDTPEWNDRSVQADIQAGFNALSSVLSIADTHGITDDKVIFIEGNHEDRYNKWMKSDNRLRTSDFPKTVEELIKSRHPELEMTYVPFLTPYILHGTAFQHYHVSGVMNRPHSGERPALSMLRQHHQSVVQGHKHTADWAEHTRPDGSKLYSLVCGCFVDPNSKFSYAGAARKLWWNGCYLLHFTSPGEFDIEMISLERLNRL